MSERKTYRVGAVVFADVEAADESDAENVLEMALRQQLGNPWPGKDGSEYTFTRGDVTWTARILQVSRFATAWNHIVMRPSRRLLGESRDEDD